MNNLISIIIPIYKVEEMHLKKCIESIVNQTYANIEIILILDGASKEITSICKEFSKKDNRIIVVEQENQGVSFTRNQGIKKAKGDWIAFVDADDWIEKDTYKNAIDKIDLKYDFIMMKNYVNYNESDNKEVNGKYHADTVIDEDFKKYIFQSVYGTKNGTWHCCESVWGNLYNRKFIIENNIEFDTDLEVGEDLIFNFKVWDKSNIGLYINEFLYHYRKHASSVMYSGYSSMRSKYEKLFIKYEIELNQIKCMYKENSECFYLRQIQRFAENYFFSKENKENFLGKVHMLREYINTDLYKKKIKEMKISQLNNKKKIFLLLLKLRMLNTLALIFIHQNN